MCDNHSTIAIAKIQCIMNDRMEHIDIDYHFITEKIENNTINLRYVPSQLRVADIFYQDIALNQRC